MTETDNEKVKPQPDNRMVLFGERVKKLRESLHLLQKDFAASIGISNSFLSDIEAGKTRASFEFFYYITQKHKANIPYLLHGKGEMFVKEDTEPVMDYGPDSDIIRQMLNYIRQFPSVRFAVLGFFKGYLFDKREMLKAEMELLKKSKKEGEPVTGIEETLPV